MLALASVQEEYLSEFSSARVAQGRLVSTDSVLVMSFLRSQVHLPLSLPAHEPATSTKPPAVKAFPIQ